MKPIKLGIVGAAGRGGHFARLCAAVGGITLEAVCDLQADAVEKVRHELGAKAAFTDYAAMLTTADLDAVLIGTPMPVHVAQAIAALASGRHVLCEVTAASSLAEARQLVAATRSSSAIYMLAENYGYQAPNVLVTALVRHGLFGETYQAEGEYLHELRGMLEATSWRRAAMADQPGIAYPTHSLGPILEWMPGDRIERLTCADTGSHHRDAQGVPYHHDSSTLLGKTRAGRLIKLRFDLISDRPHAMSNYQLQGTDGCYESGRADGEWGRIWCRGLGRKVEWMDPRTLMQDRGFAERYLPEWFLRDEASAFTAGHGGGDFFVLRRFCQTIRGEIANPCDVHAALDQTLPGLISQDPAAGERWLAVPDSRTW